LSFLKAETVKVIFLGDGIGFALAGADSTTGVALEAETLTTEGRDEVAFGALVVFGVDDFEEDFPKDPKDGIENFGLSSSFALAGVATTGFFFILSASASDKAALSK